MKTHTSESLIQRKTIRFPILSKLSSQNTFENSQQRCPFLSMVPDEPVNIRRILYYKPEISAKSWIVVEGSTGQMIDGANETEVREIASLTKIATCIVAIQEAFRLKKNFDEYIEVSKIASDIDGTSAGLRCGDCVKIWDLLHGLMLPSGNDAALALAEYFGGLTNPNQPTQSFIDKMNVLAKILKMNDTFFRNPHGMSNSINSSSVKSLAILTLYAVKNSIFCKIVNTYSHSCTIFNNGATRNTKWINTNRLLRKGFNGVKTGYTPMAGPCLSSYIEQRNKKIVIIILGAKSMDTRWREAILLWKWANAHVLRQKF